MPSQRAATQLRVAYGLHKAQGCNCKQLGSQPKVVHVPTVALPAVPQGAGLQLPARSSPGSADIPLAIGAPLHTAGIL